MIFSFSLFFFKNSLVSSAEIPSLKASLISVTHSSSMYWSFVSALPVTTYPPIIVSQLGHHSLKHLRPVALRPHLSKGLPLSIKKSKKTQIIQIYQYI